MGRDKRKITHRVTIKRVNIINPRLLALVFPHAYILAAHQSFRDVSKLLRPRESGDSPELNAMSLNLLQLIVRQAPNLRHRFPADARSFYVAQGSKDLRVGLSAWRGYFQCVPTNIISLVLLPHDF